MKGMKEMNEMKEMGMRNEEMTGLVL